MNKQPSRPAPPKHNPCSMQSGGPPGGRSARPGIAELHPIAISAAQAWQSLGISRAHFYELRRSDRMIRPVRCGRRRLFDAEELRAWFKAGMPAYDVWQAMKEGGQ